MGVWTIAGGKTETENEIKIRGLYKTFLVSGKEISVLRGLDLDLEVHGITVILGRSGCGKTTLLRIAAGLEEKDRGELFFPGPMNLGTVFQEPRLMPWLTVRQNILFGLKKNQIQNEKIERLVEMTGLSGFEQAFPNQLSGGMQQRTALARALAYDAPYILMDEPFAALDYFTRKNMQDELLRIWQASRKGVLFVTHSIDEALVLGRRIVILEEGKSKNEYDLRSFSYPRDLLSPDMIEIKKEIIAEL